MSVARFAVTRRVGVTMLSLAIVILGLFAVPRLAVALLPSFAPPVVSVSVVYPNASPETMETSVTRPIENAVSRVSGIEVLESNSYEGLSTVRVQFTYGTDINVAANDVQQQVARIRSSLPNDPTLQEPQVIKADPNATPVLVVSIADSQRTQRDLSDLMTNQLSDEFASVHGVGSVGFSGVTQRAIMIEPNEHQLAAAGISLDTLLSRVANENVNLPAGIIQIGPREYGIRTNALYTTPDSIGNTIVAVVKGVPFRLRDVATVRDAIQDQRVFSRLNGTPSLQMTITAQPDANITSVGVGVSAKIRELQRRYPTMKFATLLDQREFILAAAASLEHTAIYGAVLAVLIILLFLHSWRTTLIVAFSLPISVLGTLFVCYALNETLNVMTLGGMALAVGLIVDDAVVVIENISRYLRTGMSAVDAAEGATSQIIGAVVASSLTVITVFFPVLLIPGLQGLIFGPFGIVVMTAVAISFLVAVTTVPMLSAQFLRRSKEGDRAHPLATLFDRQYARVEDGYRRLLSYALDRPRLVVGSAAALLAITLIALKLGAVQTEIFPPSDSRFVQFGLQTPNGTALDVTNRVSRVVENALVKDPRVAAVGATVGEVGAGSNTRSISNRATLAVALKPGMAKDASAFVNEWRKRLSSAHFPELAGSIVRGQTIDIVQRQVSQGQSQLELEVYGPDLNTLQTVSDGVMTAIARIPGVSEPDKNVTNSQPEINVSIDRRMLMQMGLGTGDLAQLIGTATNGSIASYYQVNGLQYPIIVELPPSQRKTLGSLENLNLSPTTSAPPQNGASPTPGISLGGVATLTTGFGPSAISRENRQRRVEIQAPINGRPLGPILDDTERVLRTYPFPQGYRWEFGPEIMQGRNSFNSLWLVIGLAVLLIYMLLATQFESYIDPLVIMVAAPLSLIGIVGSLLITHRAFGLTAFIGSLMLVGIAVKNAILVIEFTKQLREDGKPARDALLQAGPLRLRPILMTTLATLGGMLPLAIGIETGSSTQAPLATVVIGGLIASTILSLLVVPTIYLVFANASGGRFRTRRSVPASPNVPAPDHVR
ncbi:MAG: efflux RND transporter permease subunit [Vulcanimicrobiaceae bacterium]